jgi:hypothetical protein
MANDVDQATGKFWSHSRRNESGHSPTVDASSIHPSGMALGPPFTTPERNLPTANDRLAPQESFPPVAPRSRHRAASTRGQKRQVRGLSASGRRAAVGSVQHRRRGRPQGRRCDPAAGNPPETEVEVAGRELCNSFPRQDLLCGPDGNGQWRTSGRLFRLLFRGSYWKRGTKVPLHLTKPSVICPYAMPRLRLHPPTTSPIAGGLDAHAVAREVARRTQTGAARYRSPALLPKRPRVCRQRVLAGLELRITGLPEDECPFVGALGGGLIAG